MGVGLYSKQIVLLIEAAALAKNRLTLSIEESGLPVINPGYVNVS